MARIRTLKPEFWSHPILSRMDDCTKLLAIALLNYADDEGYFLANCTLIRNFARPFDLNTKKVKVSLEKLKKIGFIIVNENSSEGEIGKIVKFAENQRVDHPRPSTLKDHFSENNSGTIPDEFRTKGKGRERKGKEGGARARSREETPGDEKKFLPDFFEIHEALTGEIFQAETCIGKNWDADDFYKFSLDWLETKKLSGDYAYPITRLKQFLIDDFQKKIAQAARQKPTIITGKFENNSEIAKRLHAQIDAES